MAERARVQVSYEPASGGARRTGSGKDLSLGGVFVETSEKPPAVGSLVTMDIESGSTRVTLDARVLSSRAEAAGPSAPAGFAVAFIDLPAEAASQLQFLLAVTMPRRGTTLGLGEAEDGVPKYVSSRKLPAAPPSSPADEPAAPAVVAAAAPAPAPAPAPAATPIAAPRSADVAAAAAVTATAAAIASAPAYASPAIVPEPTAPAASPISPGSPVLGAPQPPPKRGGTALALIVVVGIALAVVATLLMMRDI